MSVPTTDIGLQGQVQVTVGPGESLSCPHSADSGSTDLPRGIGGSPGELEVGCDSWWGQ